MIPVQRPGREPLEIECILIDFEGTLAADGRVHPKARDKMNLLSKRTKIYVLAKEPKEPVETVLRKVKAERVYFKEGEGSQTKINLLQQLGEHRTAVIGNGVDDISAIEKAGLGICVMSKEGTAQEAFGKADVVFMNILDALDFLLKPLRQRATLGK